MGTFPTPPSTTSAWTTPARRRCAANAERMNERRNEQHRKPTELRVFLRLHVKAALGPVVTKSDELAA